MRSLLRRSIPRLCNKTYSQEEINFLKIQAAKFYGSSALFAGFTISLGYFLTKDIFLLPEPTQVVWERLNSAPKVHQKLGGTFGFGYHR